MKNNHTGTWNIEFNEGVFYVSGDLRFSTVMGLDAKAKNLFSSKAQLTLDFSRIHSSDSAGLALIIEWVKLAKQHQQTIKMLHIPNNLLLIAKAAGLNHVIPRSVFCDEGSPDSAI